MKNNTIDYAFSIPTRDPLKIALNHLVTDWRFMRDHGWTLAAYTQRYGTTRKPLLGDGGPLIWQADVGNHNRLRAMFLHEAHKSFSRLRSNRRAHLVYKLILRDETRWESIVEQTHAIKEPKRAA